MIKLVYYLGFVLLVFTSCEGKTGSTAAEKEADKLQKETHLRLQVRDGLLAGDYYLKPNNESRVSISHNDGIGTLSASGLYSDDKMISELKLTKHFNGEIAVGQVEGIAKNCGSFSLNQANDFYSKVNGVFGNCEPIKINSVGKQDDEMPRLVSGQFEAEMIFEIIDNNGEVKREKSKARFIFQAVEL